jgi:hypothetical protein
MGIWEENHSRTPTCRWIPARQRVEVDYCAVLRAAELMPTPWALC